MSTPGTLRASLLAPLALVASHALAEDPVEEWRVSNVHAFAAALDSQGNLFHGSVSQTVKRAPDGTVLWTRSFDLPGGHTASRWMTVDSQDGVILGGYHEGPGGGYLAVKYDADGNYLWHSIASIGTGPQAIRVAVDEHDDVYLFGEIWGGASGTGPTGHDFMTVKFDSAGAFQWAQVAHGTGSDEPRSLAVQGGRVAVTGSAGSAYMTVCYDYAGNELWKRLYTDGIWGGNDVVIGSSGQVTVCGWGTTDGTFPYVGTVVQYDAAGNEAWRVYHNGPFGPVDNFVRLATDDEDAIVAVGWGGGAGAYSDWTVVKIDAAGTLLWDHQLDGFSSYDETATCVTIAPSGSVYVGGKAGPSCTGIGMEGVLLKLTRDGTRIWDHHLACGSFPVHLFLDPTGALMVGGQFQVFRLRERVGSTYCSPAALNSTGLPAMLLATGSSTVAHGELVLTADQLPPMQFGYFLASRTQGLVVGPGGSQGNLCLGGTIARFAGGVQSSGAAGGFSLAVDLGAIPTTPPRAVVAGETWSFQAWFRDANPGATSNFTDGVAVSYP